MDQKQITITVSATTFDALKKRAEPFVDTPDDVIARLLGVNGTPPTPRRRRSKPGTPRPSRAAAPWQIMNWELPNEDLAFIWKVDRRKVVNRRQNQRAGPPKWRPNVPDGDYNSARQAEEEKAKQHLEPIPTGAGIRA